MSLIEMENVGGKADWMGAGEIRSLVLDMIHLRWLFDMQMEKGIVE